MRYACGIITGEYKCTIIIPECFLFCTWLLPTWKSGINSSVFTTCLDSQYLSQMKHQLDATLCRFYFCRVTLHVSGASAHHQQYLKLVQRPLVHVLSLQVSHHISLLGPEGPNKEMWWPTCFGRKRPSSGVFKTSTAATGTCVIVAGTSSHLLISAGTECL